MLFISVIERVGLNPVVFITKHCSFVGSWLIDQCSHYITNDDPMLLRKKVANKDLLIFETKLAFLGSHSNFSQAIDGANRLFCEEYDSEFLFFLDIKEARKRNIKPMRDCIPINTEDKTPKIGVEPIPNAPTLPPVRLIHFISFYRSIS